MSTYAFLENRTWQFWLLQLVGWSGAGMTSYVGVTLAGQRLPGYALYLLVVCVIGLLITLLLRRVFLLIWDLPEPRRIMLVLVSTLLAAALWVFMRRLLFGELYPDEAAMRELKDLGYLFATLVSSFWIMLLWSGLYFGIKYYLLLQQEREQHLRLAGIAQETQLKMLRYQLNPHFLFNTLNAISTLILERQTDLAASMVQKLSVFLRHSLDSDPMQKVTVGQEVAMLRGYLDIERVRFDERLSVHIDIAPDVEQALLPSMLLQPLVENAIKYAIAVSPNGGCIGISARANGAQLSLEVADDGPGLKPQLPAAGQRSGGVGLSNIRERLRELYGDRQSMRLTSTQPHGLTVTIEIPLQYGVMSV